jgi:hypothetical protein
LDEAVSIENAVDGLIENEGVRLKDEPVDLWPAVGYEYLARNLEADTGMRMAGLGLDPSEFEIRF